MKEYWVKKANQGWPDTFKFQNCYRKTTRQFFEYNFCSSLKGQLGISLHCCKRLQVLDTPLPPGLHKFAPRWPPFPPSCKRNLWTAPYQFDLFKMPRNTPLWLRLDQFFSYLKSVFPSHISCEAMHLTWRSNPLLVSWPPCPWWQYRITIGPELLQRKLPLRVPTVALRSSDLSLSKSYEEGQRS